MTRMLALVFAWSLASVWAAPVPSAMRIQFNPGEITTLCQASIDQTQRDLDALAKSSPDAVLAFDKILSDLSDAITPIQFMGYVSTDEKIRDEGMKCEETGSKFLVTVYTRRDLYDAIRKMKISDRDEKRLQSELKKQFEKNGLSLSDEKLAQFKSLMSELKEKETQYSANLNNDTTTLSFSVTDLTDVPAVVLERLKKDDKGAYLVPVYGPQYVQIMENCSKEETRKTLMTANQNRAAKTNVALLEEALVLRKKIATIMGLPSWADYQLSLRMAKNPKRVQAFLDNLKAKLKKRERKELTALLAFKKTKWPDAKEIFPWDLAYLIDQIKKRDYQLDVEEIRQYFPAERVVKEMFNVYQTLLGVRFEPSTVPVWFSDVKAYDIFDVQTNELIGRFYADFYPRPGKYSHAAAFSLFLGRRVDGSYTVPTSAIVANFNPSTKDKPSLLSHGDVDTLFHEFGHIMHQTLTRAPYGLLSGSDVARDFVETMSQMMEGWVWEPSALEKITGFYSDETKKMPKDLMTRLIKAQDFMQGYIYTRQLFLAQLDMNFHGKNPPADTTAMLNALYEEILGIKAIPDAHFQANFGHLMGGYDAGYYGYLWSEVYAEDLFSQFKKGHLFDGKLGMRYRKAILERGNMEEGMDLLKTFLKRDPNDKAFLKKLNL